MDSAARTASEATQQREKWEKADQAAADSDSTSSGSGSGWSADSASDDDNAERSKRSNRAAAKAKAKKKKAAVAKRSEVSGAKGADEADTKLVLADSARVDEYDEYSIDFHVRVDKAEFLFAPHAEKEGFHAFYLYRFWPAEDTDQESLAMLKNHLQPGEPFFNRAEV